MSQHQLWMQCLCTALLSLASAATISAQTASPANVEQQLAQWLAKPAAERGELAEQPFALSPLDADQADTCQKLLWQDYEKTARAERAAEMEAKSIPLGDLVLLFDYKIFGKPGKSGRSLYISMHGGGGAPKQVNDQQWDNQKRLYAPEEGVYLAPRAPTDSWNMWHQGHMDPMLDRLIADLILFEQVDPNRVYLMGYSAGGDGVYQLAPRMADRFAAAAMMAGHPNESSPRGLRNLPFALYCGGKDAAYNRNKVTEQWGKQLDELQQADEQGYTHRVKIYPDKGHWMDREDAEAVPWMAQFNRQLTPQRIVWRQDDVTNARFYWLSVPKDKTGGGQEIEVEREGQTIKIVRSSTALPLRIRLRDDMLDLNQPIRIVQDDQVLFEGKVARTAAALAQTLQERGDPSGIFPAEVEVQTSVTPAP